MHGPLDSFALDDHESLDKQVVNSTSVFVGAQVPHTFVEFPGTELSATPLDEL